MAVIRLSQNFVPVSEFKADAATRLPQAAEDSLTEQARFLTAISEGLADADAGRVHDHAAVVARIKRRFPEKAA